MKILIVEKDLIFCDKNTRPYTYKLTSTGRDHIAGIWRKGLKEDNDGKIGFSLVRGENGIKIEGAENIPDRDEIIREKSEIILNSLIKAGMNSQEEEFVRARFDDYLKMICTVPGALIFLHMLEGLVTDVEDLNPGRELSLVRSLIEGIDDNSLEEAEILFIWQGQKLPREYRVKHNNFKRGYAPHKNRKMLEKSIVLAASFPVFGKTETKKTEAIIKDVNRAIEMISSGNEDFQLILENAVDRHINKSTEEGTLEHVFLIFERAKRMGGHIDNRSPGVIMVQEALLFLKHLSDYIPGELIYDLCKDDVEALPVSEFDPFLEEEVKYREWVKEIILKGDKIELLAHYVGGKYGHFTRSIVYFNEMEAGDKFKYLYDLSGKEKRSKIAKKIAAFDDVPFKDIVVFLPDMSDEDAVRMLAKYFAQEELLINTLLGENINYSEWIKKIVYKGDKNKFFIDLQEISDLDMDMEDLSDDDEIALFLGNFSNTDQIAISRKIFKNLNSGNVEEEYLLWVFEHYAELIHSFVRRVGILTNSHVALGVYAEGACRFLQAAEEYRAGYDLGFLNAGERGDADDDRQKAKGELSSFFRYNPSPELLKKAFRFWNEELSPGAPERKRKTKLEAGTKIKLISDKELNPLNWIVNNISKGGKTRDNRRRLHSFMMTMIERRVQREDDPVARFMSDTLLYMKTNLEDKTEKRKTVLSFLDFAMIYVTLPKYVQKNKRKAMQKLLDDMVKEVSREEGKKTRLALTAKHYDRLKNKIVDLLMTEIFKNTIGLEKEEIELIEKSIGENSEAWLKDNLLVSLARYHGFQEEEGRIAVEKYMLTLAKSRVEDDRFKDIPRYEWDDPEVSEWFGEDLAGIIQKGYKKEFVIFGGEDGVKGRYRDIWSDILVHLGIGQDKLQQIKAALKVRFDEKGKGEHFEDFWKIFETLKGKMDQGGELSVNMVKKWKTDIEKMRILMIFPFLPEFLINLDQVLIVQKRRGDAPRNAEFIITDDPVEFIRSGEKPYYTCQRITEPTGVNSKGEPINRANQGQFLLAQVKIDGYPEARAILEIASEKGSGKKILVVERLYTSGEVPSRMFQKQVMEWTIGTGLIDHIVFAGTIMPEDVSTEVSMELLYSASDIYRDTTWPARLSVLDIEKYKKKKEVELAPMGRMRAGSSSSSYSSPKPHPGSASGKDQDEEDRKKGSPAGLLKSIKGTRALMEGARSLKGISAAEVFRYRRPFAARTVAKEFEILKDLGIFIPVGGKKGYYRFPEEIKGPSEEYTKSVLDALAEIKFSFGKRNYPLKRYDIPRAVRPIIAEKAHQVIKDKLSAHIPRIDESDDKPLEKPVIDETGVTGDESKIRRTFDLAEKYSSTRFKFPEDKDTARKVIEDPLTGKTEYVDVRGGIVSGDIMLPEGEEVVVGSREFFSCTAGVITWEKEGQKYVWLAHFIPNWAQTERRLKEKIRVLLENNEIKNIKLLVHASSGITDIKSKDLARKMGLSKENVTVHIKKDLYGPNGKRVAVPYSNIIATSQGVAIIFPLLADVNTFVMWDGMKAWTKNRETGFVRQIGKDLSTFWKGERSEVQMEDREDKAVSTDRKQKGSPAELLKTIRDNSDLLHRCRTNEGITVNEMLEHRKPFVKRTVEKEFEVLKVLGIFVPVKGKKGFYRFSKKITGETTPRTKMLIDSVCNVEYRIGNVEKPLDRYDIPEEERKELREFIDLFMTVLLDQEVPLIPDLSKRILNLIGKKEGQLGIPAAKIKHNTELLWLDFQGNIRLAWDGLTGTGVEQMGIPPSKIRLYPQLLASDFEGNIKPTWKALTGTGEGQLGIPASKIRLHPAVLAYNFERNINPTWEQLTGNGGGELGIPAAAIRRNPNLLTLDFEKNIRSTWENLTGNKEGQLGIPASKIRLNPQLLACDFEGNLKPTYYFLTRTILLSEDKVTNEILVLANSLKNKIRPRGLFMLLNGYELNVTALREPKSKFKTRLGKLERSEKPEDSLPNRYELFLREFNSREEEISQIEKDLKKSVPKTDKAAKKQLKVDMVWLRVYGDEYRIASVQGQLERKEELRRGIEALIEKIINNLPSDSSEKDILEAKLNSLILEEETEELVGAQEDEEEAFFESGEVLFNYKVLLELCRLKKEIPLPIINLPFGTTGRDEETEEWTVDFEMGVGKELSDDHIVVEMGTIDIVEGGKEIYFGCGPCMGLIIHNGDNKRTYAAHSSGYAYKELLDGIAAAKKDSRMGTGENVRVIIFGSEIVGDIVDEKEEFGPIRSREEVLKSLREQGFNNVHQFFSGYVEGSFDVRFDSANSVGYLDFGMGPGFDGTTVKEYFRERESKDKEDLSPEGENGIKQNDITRDKENIETLANELMFSQLEDGRIYEIRYDAARLRDYRIEAGIDDEVSPEELLKQYVNLLKVRAKDPENIQLIKCSGKKMDSLISVRSFEDPAKKKLIGKGAVDVEGEMAGRPLRLVGMLNMALAASNIPVDIEPARISEYSGLVSFIQRQFRDLTGRELSREDLLTAIRHIVLPAAEPIPVEALGDYYRNTIQRVLQAA